MGTMFVLALSSRVVLATEPAGGEMSSPASDWLIATIDATREVGYNVSVATDPVTGHHYISYYEGDDGDLWLARTGAPTGNCGPGNTWECQVIDSAGVVGKYSSIAVGGPFGLPETVLYIAYHDVTNGSLKVMEGTVERWTGNLSYTTYVIESGDPGSDLYMGTRTSVDVVGLGTAHIAYQSHVGPVQAVKYARRVDPGTGNCGEGPGSGYWACSQVQLDIGIGDFIDIELGPTAVPNIAFSTTGDTHAYPMIAHLVPSGGSCNNSDLWECSPIRHSLNSDDTGGYLSFKITPGGVKHLAYRNATMESLEWAKYVGLQVGNCGPQNRYQCSWIDHIGPGTSPSGIAIDTDNSSEPIIAYQDLESGYEDLKIARPLDATPWAPAGNCGPADMWLCETLEEGSLAHSYAYGGLSITMNASGEAAVAYRELWGVPPTDGRLKIGFEPFPIFVDGFETGDTTRWSTTAP